MILITGATGSGKTELCKALEKMGYNIVDTYTTRPSRPDDAFTKCINQNEFDKMIDNDELVSCTTYSTKYGKVSYAFNKTDFEDLLSSVVVVSKPSYDDIIQYITNYYPNEKDMVLLVYINVDKKTIITNKTNRGITNTDTIDRLKRDAENLKILELKADLFVQNNRFEHTPQQIAERVNAKYIEKMKLSITSKLFNRKISNDLYKLNDIRSAIDDMIKEE